MSKVTLTEAPAASCRNVLLVEIYVLNRTLQELPRSHFIGIVNHSASAKRAIMLRLVLRVASVFVVCVSITLALCVWLRQRVVHASVSSSSSSTADSARIHVASLSLQDFSSLANLQASFDTIRFVFETEYYSALLCFGCVYLIKQVMYKLVTHIVFYMTFAIPGSALLNLFAGAMFPLYVAFPLVCALTTAGASCCFLLSKSLASPQTIESVCDRFVPGQRRQLQQKIQCAKETNDLLLVLLFLRLFPFSPNWLLNLASPWLQVPLHLFATSVLVGLMPYNFISVQAGSMLGSLQSTRDLLDPMTLASLVLCSAGVLIPTLLKKKKHESESHAKRH